MKSFFVIKGTPNRWFDQKGNEIPIYRHDTPDARHVIAEGPVDCNYEIHNPERVKKIILSFHVCECYSMEEVQIRAKQQSK